MEMGKYKFYLMQRSGNFSKYTTVLVYPYYEVKSDWHKKKKKSGFKPWIPYHIPPTSQPLAAHGQCSKNVFESQFRPQITFPMEAR